MIAGFDANALSVPKSVWDTIGLKGLAASLLVGQGNLLDETIPLLWFAC